MSVGYWRRAEHLRHQLTPKGDSLADRLRGVSRREGRGPRRHEALAVTVPELSQVSTQQRARRLSRKDLLDAFMLRRCLRVGSQQRAVAGSGRKQLGEVVPVAPVGRPFCWMPSVATWMRSSCSPCAFASFDSLLERPRSGLGAGVDVASGDFVSPVPLPMSGSARRRRDRPARVDLGCVSAFGSGVCQALRSDVASSRCGAGCFAHACGENQSCGDSIACQQISAETMSVLQVGRGLPCRPVGLRRCRQVRHRHGHLRTPLWHTRRRMAARLGAAEAGKAQDGAASREEAALRAASSLVLRRHLYEQAAAGDVFACSYFARHALYQKAAEVDPAVCSFASRRWLYEKVAQHRLLGNRYRRRAEALLSKGRRRPQQTQSKPVLGAASGRKKQTQQEKRADRRAARRAASRRMVSKGATESCHAFVELPSCEAGEEMEKEVQGVEGSELQRVSRALRSRDLRAGSCGSRLGGWRRKCFQRVLIECCEGSMRGRAERWFRWECQNHVGSCLQGDAVERRNCEAAMEFWFRSIRLFGSWVQRAVRIATKGTCRGAGCSGIQLACASVPVCGCRANSTC